MPNDIPTLNFSTRNSGQAYQELSKSLAEDPDAAKLNQDQALGTLDDHVDITDPSYDEVKTKQIETELAEKDGVEPLPEDPVLEAEAGTLAIAEPNAPDPF